MDIFFAGKAGVGWFSSSKIIYENGDERGAPFFPEQSVVSGELFRWRISSIEMVLAMIQTDGIPDAPLKPIRTGCSGCSPCTIELKREKGT